MLTTLWAKMKMFQTALKALVEKLREQLMKFLTNLNRSVETSTLRIQKSQECSRGIVQSQILLNQHYRNIKARYQQRPYLISPMMPWRNASTAGR